MSKQLELVLNEDNELHVDLDFVAEDLNEGELDEILDKVKRGINKETDTNDFIYKKEGEVKEDEEDTKKPTLDYVDINSKVGLRDEEGNLDVSSDLKSLERFTEYTKKLLPKFNSRYEQLITYIDRGLYKSSIRTEFKLDEYEYKNFVNSLFDIYKENDRGDNTFAASALYYNSYALRVGRKKLLSKYEFKKEWLPEEDFLDGNTILEDKDLTAVRISLFTSKGDVDTAKNLVKNFAKRTFHPATPTYSNAGISRSGEPTSCYIFVAEDDIDSINYLVSVALQKSKRGGGIGYDLSNLRAVGESIKEVEGRAKGIIPVAKGIEWAVNYADQDGKRPGSAVVYLNVFHPDIEVFLDSKKENADVNIRLSTLSTGICIPDKFMELYEKGEDYYTFYPRSIYDEYGKSFNELDITSMYDELVANPRVKKKKIKIKDLVTTIAKIHGMRGYPYIFFTDNVNKQHAFKNKKVICSNLC